MGRSVSYLNNSEVVIYFHKDFSIYFENGEIDEISNQLEIGYFINDLKQEIKSKFSSYSEVEKWEKENKIILENEITEIAISDYMGGWSLSIRAKTDYYNGYIETFGKNFCWKIREGMEKILDNLGVDVLRKLGTFSNGNSIYEKKEV